MHEKMLRFCQAVLVGESANKGLLPTHFAACSVRPTC